MLLSETNFQRIGKKIAQNRLEKELITQSTASFSSDTKMNHDKKAEKGKRILQEILNR
jgi:predicted lactoylglutathione lyase